MCGDPVTMSIMMGLQAGAGVMQYKAQKQQAEQQKASQQAASMRELQRQQMAMGAERMQQADEETAMAQEKLKANREIQESISTTATAATEVNVAGTSVGLNIQDFEQKNAAYQASLDLQARMNDAATRLALENSGQQYVSNMVKINQPIAKPNALGIALNTAMQMTQTYMAGQTAGAQSKIMGEQKTLMTAQTDLARQNLQIAKNQTALQAAQSGLYSASRFQQQ